MTNCVHPLVAFQALSQPYNQTPLVRKRFQGIQANTSPLPPEELDQAKTLQTADPYTLAQHIMALQHLIPLKIYGAAAVQTNAIWSKCQMPAAAKKQNR